MVTEVRDRTNIPLRQREIIQIENGSQGTVYVSGKTYDAHYLMPNLFPESGMALINVGGTRYDGKVVGYRPADKQEDVAAYVIAVKESAAVPDEKGANVHFSNGRYSTNPNATFLGEERELRPHISMVKIDDDTRKDLDTRYRALSGRTQQEVIDKYNHLITEGYSVEEAHFLAIGKTQNDFDNARKAVPTTTELKITAYRTPEQIEKEKEALVRIGRYKEQYTGAFARRKAQKESEGKGIRNKELLKLSSYLSTRIDQLAEKEKTLDDEINALKRIGYRVPYSQHDKEALAGRARWKKLSKREKRRISDDYCRSEIANDISSSILGLYSSRLKKQRLEVHHMPVKITMDRELSIFGDKFRESPTEFALLFAAHYSALDVEERRKAMTSLDVIFNELFIDINYSDNESVNAALDNTYRRFFETNL